MPDSLVVSMLSHYQKRCNEVILQNKKFSTEWYVVFYQFRYYKSLLKNIVGHASVQA